MGSQNSSWASSFNFDKVRILIVCRGPVRLEAIQAFNKLGIDCGILLSEKDSVTYLLTLAPELRVLEAQNIHRISDYTGNTQEERKAVINKIIAISHENNYNYVFAGYGFMSEDADFVTKIEAANLGFIGPQSQVHRLAGAKDTAKTIARQLKVSVTPGIDNISALTLIAKHKAKKESLSLIVKKHKLAVKEITNNDIEEYAEAILQSAYKKGVPLISLSEIQLEAQKQASKLFEEIKNTKQGLRLKYIGGGGGKGQRVITKATEVPNAVLEILSEAKAMGESDNRNFLIELNIENIRHNEIQLLGNGEWCVSLGGRDCSLQMHEQKQVELSITDELFATEIEIACQEKQDQIASVLEKDRKALSKMEEQAVSFAKKVNLNSAATFETIVSEDSFFFMEMNTRIQVEHRVSEMVYKLRFYNPNNKNDFFEVESLLQAMVYTAVHAKTLPCPQRIPKHLAGGEVRLNAQNNILQPAAGGLIEYWSSPLENELRDDQGIGIKNPDTKAFIPYHLAGAYDSNIALLVSCGNNRRDNLDNLANILRCMELQGENLQTNRDFLYGIINFCLGLHPMLKPNTSFVQAYLCAVANLAMNLENIDWDYAYHLMKEQGVEISGSTKNSLILSPLQKLQKNPHIFAGWLGRHLNRAYTFENERLVWKRKPLRVLKDIYHYLRLEKRENALPINQIWDHDDEKLNQALDFYDNIEKDSLDIETAPTYITSLQSELVLMDLLLYAGKKSGILDIKMDNYLRPLVPSHLFDKAQEKKSLRALMPLAEHAADMIVAESGGMFYSRETPDSKPYLELGDHFKKGDPLYIIEVMKMFNKVHAEFSGKVTEILVKEENGKVIKKGQALFRVEPDETLILESTSDKKKRKTQYTIKLWDIANEAR